MYIAQQKELHKHTPDVKVCIATVFLVNTSNS